MSRFKLYWLVSLILLMAGSTLAGSFVSFRGKFHITYPETWKQIDYLTTDTYLNQAGAKRRALDFEAAFALAASVPWYRDAYLILTVDTIPGMSAQQADSILMGLEAALETTRKERTSTTLLTDLAPGSLTWDPATRTAAVITETARKAGEKTSLLMVRFLDRGVANFFFYATDSAFQAHAGDFASIATSLSTENLESAMPRESVKIADPKKIEKATASSERRIPIWAPTSGFIVVIILIAVAVRRRRRKAKVRVR